MGILAEADPAHDPACPSRWPLWLAFVLASLVCLALGMLIMPCVN